MTGKYALQHLLQQCFPCFGKDSVHQLDLDGYQRLSEGEEPQQQRVHIPQDIILKHIAPHWDLVTFARYLRVCQPKGTTCSQQSIAELVPVTTYAKLWQSNVAATPQDTSHYRWDSLQAFASLCVPIDLTYLLKRLYRPNNNREARITALPINQSDFFQIPYGNPPGYKCVDVYRKGAQIPAYRCFSYSPHSRLVPHQAELTCALLLANLLFAGTNMGHLIAWVLPKPKLNQTQQHKRLKPTIAIKIPEYQVAIVGIGLAIRQSDALPNKRSRATGFLQIDFKDKRTIYFQLPKWRYI